MEYNAYNPITGKYEAKQYYIHSVGNGYYNAVTDKFDRDKENATYYSNYNEAFLKYKAIKKIASMKYGVTLDYKFWKETEVIGLYPELLLTIRDKELYSIVGVRFRLNRFKERMIESEFETGFKPASFDSCLRLIHSLTYDKNIYYILR